MDSNYPICYTAVRKYEGGNDDDPRDPGGRTSRGIIQREWTRFCKTHPGRPADVWKAPEADIATIYKVDYWDAQFLDAVFSGLDETLFDYGVNSGIGRSAKVLRRCLHLPDNAPRADVFARIKLLDADKQKILIAAINDERLAFLKSLHTWQTFGRGWGARVESVKSLSFRLLSSAAIPSVTAPPLVPDAGIDKTSAKGQYAEPTTAKNVVKTAGGGGSVAAGGNWLDWINAHPIETALIAVAVIAAIGGVIYLINRWHKNRQEAPVSGWQAPPELAPQGVPA